MMSWISPPVAPSVSRIVGAATATIEPSMVAIAWPTSSTTSSPRVPRRASTSTLMPRIWPACAAGS
jgi:hypothetical protein